jgi:glutathione synthase
VQRAAVHYSLSDTRSVPLGWFDVVFMRKDPPFDLTYYFATQLLGLVEPRTTLVVNDPRGLREANEKLYALRFPTLIPESLVSAEPTLLKAFMERLGGEMIVKPLDGCGGAGVFHVHRADRNLNAILELSTLNGTRLVMAQRYLSVVRESGDKRLIVLDGEPLGAIRRIPREDEHRGNIHVGGRVERAEVDARDREICSRMAPQLAADGLYFVGLDVIGGFVTEVNVTSPTGIQEIDRLNGTNLEARVLDFVEERAAQLDRRGAPA